MQFTAQLKPRCFDKRLCRASSAFDKTQNSATAPLWPLSATPLPCRLWSFDAKGEAFKLAIEAKRIDLAFLFDRMMAVHTSNVEPPHHLALYDVKNALLTPDYRSPDHLRQEAESD